MLLVFAVLVGLIGTRSQFLLQNGRPARSGGFPCQRIY